MAEAAAELWKSFPHSLKARLVVTMVEARKYRLLNTWYNRSAPLESKLRYPNSSMSNRSGAVHVLSRLCNVFLV